MAGNIADEIRTYARQQPSTWSLSARTATGVQHAILRSIAEKVVRTADCPVLTIRAKSVQVLANAPEKVG